MVGETGRDLTTIVANISADLFKEGIKVSATVAKELLLTLLKNAMKRSELKSGKVNLKKLINSGQEIKRVTIKATNVEEFSKKAKQFGLAFTVVGEKDKSDKAILFKANDMELMKQVLEDIIDKQLEIKEEVENVESQETSKEEVENIESQETSKEEVENVESQETSKEEVNSENKEQEKYYLVDTNSNTFAEIKNYENSSEISIFDNLAKVDNLKVEKENLTIKIQELGLAGYTVMTEKDFKNKLNSLEVENDINETKYSKTTENEKVKPSVRERLKAIHKENSIKRQQVKEEKSHNKTKQEINR